MNVLIRDFAPGDQAALRQVFMSSIHGLARGFYTDEQLGAWAPAAYDERKWADRMLARRPFVAVVDGEIAGYADLQDSGHIDHFFVAAAFGGKGVGSRLMGRIHQGAAVRGIPRLSADVSLAAESFFARHGFAAVRRRTVVVAGVPLDNTLMIKQLSPAAQAGAGKEDR